MKSVFKRFLSVVLPQKEQYLVYGEQGAISTKITLPENFDTNVDKCPMAILMHGFMANKKLHPISTLANVLAKNGIASISFDFNAHGNSEGEFINMTIANETSDAKAVFNYVKELPYVSEIIFVGHSQGGVIAGLLAGELEEEQDKPKSLVLLAPAAVLKDDAIAGQCMGKKYNPADPPEYVNVMFHKLGRTFIKAAQKLPIYEVSCKYSGKVCIVHGKKDKIVPYSYSEKYNELYPDSELHLLEEEGHFMSGNKDEIMSIVVDFIEKNV